MNKSRIAVVALGAFAGLLGASHGPGEILQGNVAPSSIKIEAWPEFTAYGGVPAMTVVPSFMVTGVLAIIFGLMVAAWAVAFVERKHGGLWLVLLSIIMLLVGGGLVPPFFGVAAGLIGEFNNHKKANTSLCRAES